MKSYTRRTPEQWETLVAEHQASQLSAPEFCKQHDIAYASFSKWRTKLKPAIAEPAGKKTSTPFVELTAPANLETAESQWRIELDLARGVQLRIAR